MTGRLVGREAQLATLDALRAGALAGDGGVALVVGEAGIGKSAVVEEAARRAAGASMPVLAGRAVADDGVPAFWPWLRALDRAEQLPGLSPELLDLRGEPDGSAAARFHAVDRTAEALREAAEPAGLFVVLEDLQWADDGTLALLRHLATGPTGSRALVLGTWRDPDGGRPAPAALIDLAAQASVRVVPVGALGVDDVTAYLGGAHRSWPAYVHRLSGGNPLFVRELARLLDRDGRLARPAAGEPAGLGVPSEVRRLVARRLDPLTPECRTLLGACAVAGEEVDAALVGALVPGAETPLAEAVAAGVLVDDPLSPATLRFSHDLVRRTAYAELPRADRIGWHRRIADTLEPAAEGRVAELARHRVRAGVAAAGGAPAPDASAAAARAAPRGLDLAAAAEWYRQALDLLDGDPARRADLLLGRADAAFGDGQFASALADCARVTDLAEELGRPDLAAAAAVVVRGFAYGEEGAALCERARALLGDEDSARHAGVLAQHAFILAQAGRLDEADGISRRAMAMAERSGDPAALVGALHARHQVAGAPEDVAERLALGTRMVELAGVVGRTDTELWGHLWRMDAAYQLGTMAAVDAELAALSTLVERRGGLLARWHLLRARATRAAIAGQFEAATRLAGEARAVGGALQDPSGEGMYWAFMVSLTPWLGEVPGIRPAVDELTEFAGEWPIVTSSTSLFWMRLGDREQAAAWLDRLRPRLADLPRDLLWLPVLVMGGEAAAKLGDLPVARHCYELLVPHRAYHANAITAVQGSVSRVLGVIAHALGDLDAADRHLTEAATLEERIGALPPLALARLDHVRLLAARGRA
ncbi:AAA family ATPase, partial [Micromonospora sp. CPCC 205371]|nr:AAA family ATPase [Micromonospora sp. CPCC 205371]